jgi:hypothetical protein
MTGDHELGVRLEAYRRLLSRQVPLSRDHLASFVRQAMSDPELVVRTEVLGELTKWTASELGTDLMRELAHDPSIRVRMEWASTLGRLGRRWGPAVAPILAEMLADPQEVVRWSTAISITLLVRDGHLSGNLLCEAREAAEGWHREALERSIAELGLQCAGGR